MSEKKVYCPTCGKSTRWAADNRWRPFCSERCKLIDLSEWMDESRRIPDTAETLVPPEVKNCDPD